MLVSGQKVVIKKCRPAGVEQLASAVGNDLTARALRSVCGSNEVLYLVGELRT